MMNSSYDSDDGFGANPFRSDSGSSDLLGTPNVQQQPQQQQQRQYSLTSPDPQSGMVGSFELPPPTPTFQQQQQQQAFGGMMSPQQQPMMSQQGQPPQQQYPLSGTMDQNVNKSPAASSASSGMYQSTMDSTTPGSTPIGWWRRCTSCFRLEGYQPYFDLDTVHVAQRIMCALTKFWQPDQFRTAVVGDTANPELGLKGPDLYGPLWITMTLIFCIAATSNLSDYMRHLQHSSSSSSTAAADVTDDAAITSQEEMEDFEYDIYHLLRASSVCTVFVFVIPTAFWFACTCLAMPAIPWVMWVCCYGYSMTPYLLAVLIAWVPITILEWLVLAMATFASVLLILRNLSTPLLSQDAANQAKAAPILMSILGVHVVFLLVMKYLFYS